MVKINPNLKLLPQKVSFQEFYEKHKDAITDMEPDVCACGLRIERVPERMEIGQIYCDSITHVQRFDYQGKPHVGVMYDHAGFDDHGKEKHKVRYCPEYARKNAIAQADSIAIKTFENFNATQQPAAYDFCVNWKPEGRLILRGSNGLGKSHLAEAMYHRFRKAGNQCVWYDFDSLAKMFRAMEITDPYEEHVDALEQYAQLVRSDVVFVDDLGKNRERIDELFKEQFHKLLEKITGAIVITTELTSAKIKERFGGSVESRLKENLQVIWFQGEDYRAKSMKTPIKGK